MERPKIWKTAGKHCYYRMVERLKENGINEKQYGVFKVENGYVYREIYCQLNSVEDCGEYWYVGYKPIGRSWLRCGRWGYTRLYKNNVPEGTTIELQEDEFSESL